VAFGSSQVGEYNAESEPDGVQVRKPMGRTRKDRGKGANSHSRVSFHPTAYRYVLETCIGMKMLC